MPHYVALTIDSSKGKNIFGSILRSHILRLGREHWITVGTPLTECRLILYP